MNYVACGMTGCDAIGCFYACNEKFIGKRKPAYDEFIMTKLSTLHKRPDVVPCVRYPDGRVFYSSLDLARAFNVSHSDLVGLLRRWREWLPASMRQLIELESNQVLMDREVICYG